MKKSDSHDHHDQSVRESFGSQAEAYLTSAVHAQGQDLAAMRALVAATPQARVLDLGCGAGHVSFAVAPVAAVVVACDLTPEMLRTVEAEAAERGLGNLTTVEASVEQLPLAEASFDWVLSRYSAHHWRQLPRALAEARRVLAPGGRLCLVDIVGAADPLADTHLQAVELLRDPSHVRDYSEKEWLAALAEAGFVGQVAERSRLPIDFASWVARMRTPEPRIAAIRELWSAAPAEVIAHYKVQLDFSFQMEAVRFEAVPAAD